jgi:hypothetical protein
LTPSTPSFLPLSTLFTLWSHLWTTPYRLCYFELYYPLVTAYVLYQLSVCLIEFEVLSLIIGPKKIYVALKRNKLFIFVNFFCLKILWKQNLFFPFEYYCLSFLLRRRELESEQIRLFYVKLFINIFKRNCLLLMKKKSAVLFFGDLSPVATYGFWITLKILRNLLPLSMVYSKLGKSCINAVQYRKLLHIYTSL